MKKNIFIILNTLLIISAITFIVLGINSRKKATNPNIVMRDSHHFACTLKNNNAEYKYDIKTDNDYLIKNINFTETFTYATDAEYEAAKNDNTNYLTSKEVSYKEKNKQIIYTTKIEVFGDENYPSAPLGQYIKDNIPEEYKCKEVL